MFPAMGGRITGAILATVAGLAVAASALAEPTKVTAIKGEKLNLYSEAGKLVDSLTLEKVPLPLDILRESGNGKFLVEIPGTGEIWILKAQTVTDEGAPKVVVDCQSITESYATTRGLAVCN